MLRQDWHSYFSLQRDPLFCGLYFWWEITMVACWQQLQLTGVRSKRTYRTQLTHLYTLYTLQGTYISPKNGILKMIFLFPRWDMLVPWRVYAGYQVPVHFISSLVRIPELRRSREPSLVFCVPAPKHLQMPPKMELGKRPLRTEQRCPKATFGTHKKIWIWLNMPGSSHMIHMLWAHGTLK